MTESPLNWQDYAKQCEYEFPNPLDSQFSNSDLVCVGGDLEIPTLIYAYSKALFPMHISSEENFDAKQIGWFSPNQRCIFTKENLRITKSLKKSYNKFTYAINQQFETVMRMCMDITRPHGWIDEEFIDAYVKLHEEGFAHSFETYFDDKLVGGLYGVSFSGLFAGESMFHTVTDSSKCALLFLMETLEKSSIDLLDAQWHTPHLESLGAITISKSDYIYKLDKALDSQSYLLTDN
ncbi:MAG: leucyl/phenylalanyl-tRNA--protein transferase [Acidimicrobiia bacterium]